MKRRRLLAVCAVLGVAGGMAVTACGSVTQTGVQSGVSATHAASSATLSAPAPAASASSEVSAASARPPAVAARTVVFECLDHTRVEPGSYVLTCADANSVLARLAWKRWTAQQAVATGLHELNDCTPDCAVGTFRHYPVVVTFWRSEPVPEHAGQRYFTRITVRYTGPRPPAYMSNGQLVQHPAKWTQSLGT